MPLANTSSLSKALRFVPGNYKESVDMYKSDLQSKVSETFWQASDVFEIMEEVHRGTLEKIPLVCRVTHAIDPVTGLNLGDDYRRLIFEDLEKDMGMGRRYWYNDSWWITVNTNQYKYVTKSSINRRCNNVLKWIDENGNVIEEPCIVDYSLKYSNVYFNNLADIPSGAIEIITQYNETTLKVELNQRFILNSQVYKIKTASDYLRQKTFEKDSVPLMIFTAYIDTKSEFDNFDSGIAGETRYNPNTNPEEDGIHVVVEPPVENILLNGVVSYTCKVMRGDEDLGEEFTFTAKNVPEAYFDLDVIDGNSFTIRNVGPYYANPLVIECKSNSATRDIIINLKGAY